MTRWLTSGAGIFATQAMKYSLTKTARPKYHSVRLDAMFLKEYVGPQTLASSPTVSNSASKGRSARIVKVSLCRDLRSRMLYLMLSPERLLSAKRACQVYAPIS